jgi:hypothetical protein
MSGLARAAAEGYFAAVNSASPEQLATLLHPEVVLEHPAGTFHGRKAVVDFYKEVVLALGTTLAVTSVVAEGSRCVAEFEGRSPIGDDVVHACDVFEVDEVGAITSLRIYIR